MNKRLWLVVIGLGLLVARPGLAQRMPEAVWATYGLMINDTAGNTPQNKPQMQSDGQGNYFIVWEDSRAGYHNIYAQKINEAGQLFWPKAGLAVCRAEKNQNSAQLISDGAGGMIVVWQDYRNGNADIYAQRISAAGQVVWGSDSIPVCTAAAGQFAPQLITDGAGGALITWYDYRGSQGEDIYAQRLNFAGQPVWPENGLAICAASGTQWYPKIASDGADGALIVWTDGRLGSSDNNIYAQRVNGRGQLLWDKDGAAVCQAPANQERPEIISAAAGVIIAWNDFRAGNSDIFAQKLDPDAKALWAENGVALCALPYAQENPRLAPDGTGGAVVVWTDLRAEESDLYGQRVRADGNPAWTANGLAVSTADGRQRNPEIAALKSQEWLVVWEDSRPGSNNLFMQKLNLAGARLWENEGVAVAPTKQAQEAPALAVTPAGNAVITWADSRDGNTDIFSQKISAAGAVLWLKGGLTVCAVPGSVVQQNIEMIMSELGEIILVFEDNRNGFFNLYAQKINKLGQLSWGKDGLAVASVAANQTKPQIVSDGKGGCLIAWEDQRLKDAPSVRAQHLNAQGARLWESSLAVANLKSRQENPLLVSDGAGGAIIVWEDGRNLLSLIDLYGQRITGDGKLVWGNNGKIIASANGNQLDAAIVADGLGGAFVAWTDFRRGDRNPDIYAQRINYQGEPLWQEDGVPVCGAPDVQRAPKLISDNEGGLVIAWTDKGGGSYDIYAQRLDKSGRALWMTDGIPISQLSRTQQNPWFGTNNILVWEDYRYGNWDIFASAVEPGGKLRWGEEGLPVALVPHTQYAPRLVPWKDGNVIVTWEDYRSGEQYEIYIQKIDRSGQSVWPNNGLKVLTRNGSKAPRLLASPADNSFFIFWEDFTDGGRALYGQKYLAD